MDVYYVELITQLTGIFKENEEQSETIYEQFQKIANLEDEVYDLKEFVEKLQNYIKEHK